MSSLKGGQQLRRRLRAFGKTFKPYGALWADTTAEIMRDHVPERTGRLKRSIRRKNATAKRATVFAHYSANFVDAGTVAHDIKARHARNLVFTTHGRTIFAKKVHKQRAAARPFKRPAAEAALRRHRMSETLIKLWNNAA